MPGECARGKGDFSANSAVVIAKQGKHPQTNGRLWRCVWDPPPARSSETLNLRERHRVGKSASRPGSERDCTCGRAASDILSLFRIRNKQIILFLCGGAGLK